MHLKEQILDLSRQYTIGPLSPWFDGMLSRLIDQKVFLKPHDLDLVGANITHQAVAYRLETGRSTVVIGMSGGVDSALTAAFYKRAGYCVIGVTMPIHQDPMETQRGIEACAALGIEHQHLDLSKAYDDMLDTLSGRGHGLDPELDVMHLGPGAASHRPSKIRRGNIRARLRMIALYDIASLNGGFVASTDNFSELVAGFWTLHGDVGDVAPIQSLLKSWEVPYLAKTMGVPEATWRAKPTDGLGIDAGDEAQLGASYLEFDIMTLAISEALTGDPTLADDPVQLQPQLRLRLGFGLSEPGLDKEGRVMGSRANEVLNNVIGRIRSTWFKRMNPVNLRHGLDDRFAIIERLDTVLARPSIVKD